MGKKGKKTSKPAPEYNPTAQERAAMKRVFERQASKAPAARFNIEITAANAASISADHPEPAIDHSLLADALATGDCEFAGGLLTQLADVARSGKVATKQELDFILSVVHGINPKDETEALLAVQMAAIHNATIVAARRLVHTETIPQQDSASNMLNKLARTFAAQVEALKRYRSAGEQTIKVQHVTGEPQQCAVGRCVPVSRSAGRGTKGEGSPGAWRHGRFTSEAVMFKRLSAVLMRSARKTMEKLAVFSASFSNIGLKPATKNPVLKGTARRST